MKIDKIYISAFGGLKDFTLSFSDNLNVIFGENENGKTTVLAFIKAMFYGTGKKTQNLSASIRQKYTPFSGDKMGGRIFFSAEGTNYCLERQFNSSDSTDTVILTNTDSGESQNETATPGIRFFGMGAEAFERSMFIGAERNYVTSSTASGEINSKLSNIAVTGEDNVSYQKIEDIILDAKEKIISKSGRTGSYIKGKMQLDELNKRLDTAENDANRKIKINTEKQQLTESYSALGRRYLAIKKLTDSREDIKNREKLKEYLELKEQLDGINRELTMPNGKIIDTAFLGKIQFCASKINPQIEVCDRVAKEMETLQKEIELAESMTTEETEKKIAEAEKNIEELKKDHEENEARLTRLDEELNECEEELGEEEGRKKPVNLPLLIIGAVLTAAAVAVGIILDLKYLFSAGAGFVVMVLSFILRPKDTVRYNALLNEIASIKKELTEANTRSASLVGRIEIEEGKLSLLNNVLNADRSVREKKMSELEEKKAGLLKEKEKLSLLNDELQKVLDGYEYDFEKAEEIEAKVEIQKNIKLELGFLSKDLGNISYEEAKAKLQKYADNKDYSDIDFDAAENEKERIADKLSEIKQRITALDTELVTSFRNFEQPEILKKEIEELEEELSLQKEFCDCSEIALEVLKDSFAMVRKSYGKNLEEKTKEIFRKLTAGRYGAVNVSKSLDLTVEQNGVFGMRETGYLSTGTEDQAFLALRLAICSLISEKEPFPVMLDDALANYDDNRTSIAIEYLKEYAKTNQVLLFTCHNSLCRIAENLGVEKKDLLSGK